LIASTSSPAFEQSTIRVERTLSTVRGHLSWGPPKSESGRRTIAVDGTTLSIIKSHRSRQNAEKLALRAGYSDENLVFAREDGASLRPEWVSKRFHVLTDIAKLPRIHLHDLRHSAASMALTAGVPMKVVSENLGYASLRITADVYSHVTTDLAKDSAERVAATLASNCQAPVLA
jgi:integrase